MSNTVWKGFERQIARAVGTERNMGSGRINKTDAGEDRPGDIVTPDKWNALFECKTRKTYPKSGVWTRILETIEDAMAAGKKHWFHFERRTGNKKIYIMAVNEEWIEPICKFIGEELERRSNIDTDDV